MDSSIYAAARTARLATSITLSAKGNFDPSAPEEVLLFTAAASALRLYRVLPNVETALIHRLTTNLAAPVTQMCAFRREGKSHDSLLLLFDSLHLSVVEFNPTTRTIDTVAAFFLGDLHIPPQEIAMPPLLRVDPVHRVAAVLVNGHYVFLLPLGLVPVTRDKFEVLLGAGGRALETAAGGSRAGGGIESKKSIVDAWGDEDDDDQSAASPNTSQKVAAASSAGATATLTMSEFAYPILLDVPEALSKTLHTIRDICFATGYDEPTLAFLSEADSTWAGRVRILDRRSQGASKIQSNLLSCMCSWVSFDMSLLKKAWGHDRSDAAPEAVAAYLRPHFPGRVMGLPYTAAQIIPLATVGDQLPSLLCTSANAILYINTKQSFAATVNAHGDEEASQSHNSTMQWSRATWAKGETPSTEVNTIGAAVAQLAPFSLLFALESGNVFHADLMPAGSTLHEIVLSFVGSVPPASTMSLLSEPDGLLFLGSALGDSMALRCVVNEKSKKRRLRLLTSFMNTGPVVCATTIDAVSPLPLELTRPDRGDDCEGAPRPLEEQKSLNPYEVLFQRIAKPKPNEPIAVAESLDVSDLLACVGHGASGALLVTRQSIRHDVVVEKGVDAIAVFAAQLRSTKKRRRGDGGDDANDDDDDKDEEAERTRDRNRGRESDAEDYTALLFFSTANLTFIVTVGSRIRQLASTNTPFCTSARTVFATGSAETGIVVQVTEREIFLQQQSGDAGAVPGNISRLTLPNDATARCAMLLGASDSEQTLAILLASGELCFVPLRCSAPLADADITVVDIRSRVDVGPRGIVALAFSPAADLMFAVAGNGSLTIGKRQAQAKPHDFEVVAFVPRFAVFPTAVIDGWFEEPTLPPKLAAEAASSNGGLHEIAELACARLTHQRPDDDLTLVALSAAGEAAVYRVETTTLNLYKVDQRFVDRERVEEDADLMAERQRRIDEARAAAAAVEGSGDAADGSAAAVPPPTSNVRDVTVAARRLTRRLQVFSDLAGHDGIYICGLRPYILVSHRGETVVHAHRTRGPIRSFANLDTPLLPSGFVVCGEGFVQFGLLPDAFDYRQEWPSAKIPLKTTPYFVGYQHAQRSLFVVTAQKVPFRLCRAPFDVKYKTMLDEETGMLRNTGEPIPNEALPTVDASEGIPIPTVERYELSLLSVSTWEQQDAFSFLENEQVICAKEVQLSTHADLVSFQKSFLPGAPVTEATGRFTTVYAVGTAFPLGEDVPCRGRLLLFGVKIGPERRRQIRLIYEEGMKGAVTAVACMGGHLVAAIGPTVKLFFYHWTENQLVLNAFFFAGLYVAKIDCCKHYITVGDAFQSVTFWKYFPVERSVRLIARDLEDMEVLEASAVFQGGEMALVTADASRNVFVFGFTPKCNARGTEVVDSPMTLEADLRLSGCVHWMQRLRVPTLNRTALSDRALILYATREGELGFIHPVTERAKRPLKLLAKRLVTDIAHTAGLHPEAARSEAQDGAAARRQAPSHVFDLDEMRRFVTLSDTERRVVAHRAGTDAERVLHVLYRLEHDAAAFL